jgi:1-acyl-sn-glycerol-3-phosphate acyltransferase
MSVVPVLGPAVPRRGNALARAFGRGLLRLLGWRVEGNFPDLPKFVVAVAPHTSNWDFVVGIAVAFALDLRLSYLAKHTLFRWPFGAFMRWSGGIAVDRSSPHGVVGDAIRAFESVPQRVLAIAPQGTRRRVAHFKSGFLHIAQGARVPVVLATLDYDERRVRLGPWFEPQADLDAELARVESFFASVRGKNR